MRPTCCLFDAVATFLSLFVCLLSLLAAYENKQSPRTFGAEKRAVFVPYQVAPELSLFYVKFRF